MIAVEIKCVATTWNTICVGEGFKESPLYDRGEWLNDRPADFGFNASGELIVNQWGLVLAASPQYTWTKVTVPEWAKGGNDELDTNRT